MTPFAELSRRGGIRLRKFDKIKIGDEEILGSGYYQKTNKGLLIDTDDSKVNSFFKSAIRNKKRLGAIIFNVDGMNSAFAGSFLVIRVDGSFIDLVKG